MRQSLYEGSVLARPGVIEYFLTVCRFIHGLTAVLPGIALMYWQAGDAPLQQSYIAAPLLFGIATVMMFQSLGVYDEHIFSNCLRFRLMFFAWLAAFCVLLLIYQALNLIDFALWPYLAAWFVIALVLFGLERLLALSLFRYWMSNGHYLHSAVILGATENGRRLAEFMSAEQDIRTGLLGFIDDRLGRLPSSVAGLPVLGNTHELARLVREERITQVLVALPWAAEARIGQVVRELRKLPVNVLLVPDMLAFKHARNRITHVTGLPMFNVSERPLDGWSPSIKRLEDLLLCSLALLAALPVMLLVAVAIKWDSPGPVLFKQKRYGYNNRLIKVYKFRSMYVEQSDANAERQTTRGDNRITSVGRFIRKTSLDELPQLFNVLFGSMSMVGPRPHATATKAAGILFEDAVAEYSARHRVKPGITGWAQINGYRGETDTLEKIEKRVKFDLQYIENWSVWFDLYILFRTVPAVIFTKEVY